MKKRIVSLLLPVVMAASVLAGCTPSTTATTAAGTTAGTTAAGTTTAGTTAAGTTTADTAAPETTTALPDRPDVIKNVGANTIIIGTTTEPTGDFAPPYWQNNATDNDVKTFVEGLGTVEVSKAGEFEINKTVVADHKVTENKDKSKTYEFKIKDGLVYSDGTAITAEDYVLSIMLFSSPVVKALAGKPTYGTYYVGYQDFLEGKEKAFAGVRLLDKMTFSVTIAAEYVPSYFELSQASVGPNPKSLWFNNSAAGEVVIKDDGKGVYFSDNFTEANFGKSIQEAKNNPVRPASGPNAPPKINGSNADTARI